MSGNRNVRLHQFNCHYARKGRLGDPCYYCGVISNSYDHIPPLAHLAQLPAPEDIYAINCYKIPCCIECNGFLSSMLLLTFSERRAYAKARIRVKYRAVLRVPKWDEAELKGLSPDLARSIRVWSDFSDYIKNRLGWR